MQTAFFLGANSKDGFFSLYSELIPKEDAKTIYILKGTPGCGKSSFMRKIASAAQKAGYDTENIICSSDPSSLDGVIIPNLGIAFADGTSPHVIEPEYPLVKERYIDLSAFADFEGIKSSSEKIISLFKQYKSYYPRVYRLTGCAGTLANELFEIGLSASDTEKLRKKAQTIITREIKGKGEKGRCISRFLSSISPEGYVTRFDSVKFLADRVYLLEDTFGLSSFLLHPIKEAAEASGRKVICCYNPLIPKRPEHLIIPELSLAFITTSKLNPYPYEYEKRISLDSMLNNDVTKAKKQKIRFTQKLLSALLEEAYSTIKEAKSLHDELEKEYNPHIDFDSVFALAEKISDTVFH